MPWAVATAERLRIAFLYLPRLHRSGLKLPMPYMFKRGMIAQFAIQSGAKLLVETGTYMGDTPWQLRHLFDHLWSVEVHPPLAALAKARFLKVPNTTIIEADSGQALKDIVPQLNKPTLFWLDGHYSGGMTGMGADYCPIFAELDTIFGQANVPWVAMIDDARLFGTEAGYPSLEALCDYFAHLTSPPHVWVENDIVFVVPLTHPLAAKCKALPSRAIMSLLYS